MPKKPKGTGKASSVAEKGLVEAPAADTADPPGIVEPEAVRARLVAVDPGDVHVGIAEFVETADSWECMQAYELGWENGIDRVAQFLVGGQLDFLIVERFSLYADMAKTLIGSEMETAQCIGAIRYLHAKYLARATDPYELRKLAETELVFQGASIQKATDRICKAKGIPSEANGNPHARSAELHGWHFILKREGNNEAAWAAEEN